MRLWINLYPSSIEASRPLPLIRNFTTGTSAEQFRIRVVEQNYSINGMDCQLEQLQRTEISSLNGRVINIVTTERDSVSHATDIYPEIFGADKVDVDNVADLDEINQKIEVGGM